MDGQGRRARDEGDEADSDRAAPPVSGAESQAESGTVEGQVPGTQSRVETAHTDQGKDDSK